MQFRREFKEKIRAGQVSCTIRRWKRPQASVGGRYNLHPEGAIEVTAISTTTLDAIPTTDIAAAGFDSREALQRILKCDGRDEVYRVSFRYLGPEPVKRPQTGKRSAAERDALAAKLDAMDQRADAPWTRKLLSRIGAAPGVRAADIAPEFGWPTARFKAQVRKLKALGLTISLETGYELSPLGRQIVGR